MTWTIYRALFQMSMKKIYMKIHAKTYVEQIRILMSWKKLIIT